jgi:anti-sigma B factor antagonist
VTTFEVTTEANSPDAARVTVSGEVDLATAPALLQAAEELVKSTEGDVAIDMSEVTFIDSTGLGVLVQIRNAVTGRGSSLVFATPSRSVQRALSLAGLDKVFGTS